MKKLLSSLLITAAAFGFSATGAFAGDDDDCKIETVTIDHRQIIIKGPESSGGPDRLRGEQQSVGGPVPGRTYD